MYPSSGLKEERCMGWPIFVFSFSPSPSRIMMDGKQGPAALLLDPACRLHFCANIFVPYSLLLMKGVPKIRVAPRFFSSTVFNLPLKKNMVNDVLISSPKSIKYFLSFILNFLVSLAYVKCDSLDCPRMSSIINSCVITRTNIVVITTYVRRTFLQNFVKCLQHCQQPSSLQHDEHVLRVAWGQFWTPDCRIVSFKAMSPFTVRYRIHPIILKDHLRSLTSSKHISNGSARIFRNKRYKNRWIINTNPLVVPENSQTH